MKATYNLTTGALTILGDNILPLTVIIPKDQAEDYWDTVTDIYGESLYDINIYNYGGDWCAQYVNLVMEDGELIVGDDYQLMDLELLGEEIMKKVLYVKRLVFLDWYANDKEDYQNIGEMVIDSLKKDGTVTVSLEDLFEGMVELSCIPTYIIDNIKEFPGYEDEDWDYSDYEFELID